MCRIRVMAKRPMKVKRPYKYNLTKGVRVAISPELDSALRHVRRQFGVSMSHVIRMGIMVALAKQVPEAVAIAHDPTVHPTKRLKMAEFIRACAKAEASLREPEVAAAVGKTKRNPLRAWKLKPKLRTPSLQGGATEKESLRPVSSNAREGGGAERV